MRFTIQSTITTGLATALFTSGALVAQAPPSTAKTTTTKTGHSTNIHPLGHIELGEFMSIGGIAVEQEMSRPYVYVDRWHNEDGFDVISIADPSAPKIIARWRIEHPELHKLSRGETGKYFKTQGRYYYVKATEFETGTLDADVGAIVCDVTDPTKPKEVGRIKSSDFLDGFVNVMPYRYNDGRIILFAAVRNWPKGLPPHANVYDMDRFLAGDKNQGLIGSVPMPNADPNSNFGYHDIHVEYDSGSRQVRFYGAGNGGFYIFDVTRPEAPVFLTGIPTINGVPTQRAHTIIPTPDGRYVVTQMEVQFSPLMIFDLKPVWDKTEKSASVPISAWTADWQDLPHNHKMRWPYIFDAAYEDGLQVIDIRDPLKPKTAGYAYTCGCKHMTGYVDEQHIHGPSVFSGAMETDVRNADGLIVLSDLNTGFWAFRMDGFKGHKGSEQPPPNT